MLFFQHPPPKPLLGRRVFLVGVLSALLVVGAAAVCAPNIFLRVSAQGRDSARDAWQRPGEVMDALGISSGSRVADVGCGEGYFVLHLARRAGSQGRVYGVDVDEDSLEKLRRKVDDLGLENVELIHSRADDTRLSPESVDVVLVVNSYHEMRDYDAMLRSMFAALRPGGLLAIIDATGDDGETRSGLQSDHTITPELVRQDAVRNGFNFRSQERGFENPSAGRNRRAWFFLVFVKPAAN